MPQVGFSSKNASHDCKPTTHNPTHTNPHTNSDVKDELEEAVLMPLQHPELCACCRLLLLWGLKGEAGRTHVARCVLAPD